MVGGVYCPLSPLDPSQRVQILLEQMQSFHILVHYLTETKFTDGTVLINIDSILAYKQVDSNFDIDRLTTVVKRSDDLAYIISTSGSTGTPKAVSNLEKGCNTIIFLFRRYKSNKEISLNV